MWQFRNKGLSQLDHGRQPLNCHRSVQASEGVGAAGIVEGAGVVIAATTVVALQTQYIIAGTQVRDTVMSTAVDNCKSDTDVCTQPLHALHDGVLLSRTVSS